MFLNKYCITFFFLFSGHLSTVTALSLLFVSVNQACYNLLFNLTKDTFPSSIFLISVAVDIPVAVLYGYVRMDKCIFVRY